MKRKQQNFFNQIVLLEITSKIRWGTVLFGLAVIFSFSVSMTTGAEPFSKAQEPSIDDILLQIENPQKVRKEAQPEMKRSFVEPPSGTRSTRSQEMALLESASIPTKAPTVNVPLGNVPSGNAPLMYGPSINVPAMNVPSPTIPSTNVFSTVPSTAVSALAANTVLVDYQSPVIDIQATGSKRIVVGQEAPYQIRVRNSSSVNAMGLVVTTEIPAWVEVTNIQPSIGSSNLSAKTPQHEGGTLVCLWRIGTLAAGKEEILTLQLIPRQRNNFELLSRYDFDQTTLKAGIEVQEPAIELAIEGRDEIEWGVEDKYRLRIKNIGNGAAENLRLSISTGDSQQATHYIGQLLAGEEKMMEVAVKTQLTESVQIEVQTNGDYGLSASATRNVRVLRGIIDLYLEAPELQFVNNSIDCLVHVSNRGTAPLKNVNVKVAIPAEVRFISCSGEGIPSSNQGEILWNIPHLNTGEQIAYQLTCKMVTAGTSRLEVVAVDPTGQKSVQDAMIQIEAIAALSIDIKAPSGPIPVGDPVTYEVTIRNDGTKAARDISAGLYLSRAFQPIGVEFGGGTIHAEEGTVQFSRINLLGAGQTATYKVQAIPLAAGNHKVQATLTSGSEGIQLAGEALTYTYQKRTVARRQTTGPENVALAPVPSVIPAAVPLPIPVPLPMPGAPTSVPAAVPTMLPIINSTPTQQPEPISLPPLPSSDSPVLFKTNNKVPLGVGLF